MNTKLTPKTMYENTDEYGQVFYVETMYEKLKIILDKGNSGWKEASRIRFNISRMSPTEFIEGEDALFYQASSKLGIVHISCPSAYAQPIMLFEDGAKEKCKDAQAIFDLVKKIKTLSPDYRDDTRLSSYRDGIAKYTSKRKVAGRATQAFIGWSEKDGKVLEIKYGEEHISDHSELLGTSKERI